MGWDVFHFVYSTVFPILLGQMRFVADLADQKGGNQTQIQFSGSPCTACSTGMHSARVRSLPGDHWLLLPVEGLDGGAVLADVDDPPQDEALHGVGDPHALPVHDLPQLLLGDRGRLGAEPAVELLRRLPVHRA